MSKFLKKSEIFAKKGLEPKSIEVPEWGGEVLYRPMSMIERREIRKKCSITTTDSDGRVNVELDAEKLEVLTLVYCVLDPTDESRKRLMFGPDDIFTLEEEMAAGGISTVSQAILRDSGLSGNAVFRGEKKPEKGS